MQAAQQVVPVGILHRHVVVYSDGLAGSGSVLHRLASTQLVTTDQKVHLIGRQRGGGRVGSEQQHHQIKEAWQHQIRAAST